MRINDVYKVQTQTVNKALFMPYLNCFLLMIFLSLVACQQTPQPMSTKTSVLKKSHLSENQHLGDFSIKLTTTYEPSAALVKKYSLISGDVPFPSFNLLYSANPLKEMERIAYLKRTVTTGLLSDCYYHFMAVAYKQGETQVYTNNGSDRNHEAIAPYFLSSG